MQRVVVPPGLDAQRRLGPAWADWLDELPRLTTEFADEWALDLEGPVWHGYCSLVVAVRTEVGRPAVLKLSFPGDDESEHEALALQHWAGRGTVRLLRADPRRRVLLLERLDTEDLATLDYLEAAEVVGGLYAGIHRPALAQLRTITSYAAQWLDDLAGLPRDSLLPRRLVEQTLHLGRALIEDPASTGTLVHGDLHDHNVLATAPGSPTKWAIIDPKPMSGDPHYEPAPMLWNRWEEIAGPQLRSQLRRRFHTIVDTAELDEDRARDWVVVRTLLNASSVVQHGRRGGRAPSGQEADWITRCIIIVKAVQD